MPRMARQMRSGVAGISICSTPNSASASTIALTTTPSAGVVPPSPPARMPSGCVGRGHFADLGREERQHIGARHRVIHERARQELPVAGVVEALLQKRLADALRHAAMGLAVDDHRVDRAADIVDGGVAHDLDGAEFRVDLDLADMAAVREGRDR